MSESSADLAGDEAARVREILRIIGPREATGAPAGRPLTRTDDGTSSGLVGLWNS